jgi:oxygen-independent coproporphyrinogen-3 oxidase
MAPRRPAGIYIHLPFIRSTGPDADPATILQQPLEGLLEALRDELCRRFEALDGRELVSVYLGGGTASFVPNSWIATLMDDIADRRELEGREVTLEASPLDIERRRLAAWRDAGVTRVIVGVHSLQSSVLSALDATFGVSDAERAIRRCHAFGQFDYGVDLTFGVAGQSFADFRADLDRLSALGVPSSVFGYEHRLGEGDPEVTADMLEALVDWSSAHGLRRYEPASFCRPGKESIHNTLHWTGGEYLGVGLGAASLRVDGATAHRRRNPTDLATYLAAPGEPADQWHVAPDAYLAERLELACRSRVGLDVEALRRQFDGAVDRDRLEAAEAALAWAVDVGLAEWAGQVWRPTGQGLNVADGAAERLKAQL